MSATQETDGTAQVRNMVREAITNAYYGARNHGQTMETAADNATSSIMRIVESVDTNARNWGRSRGLLDGLTEMHSVMEMEGLEVSSVERSIKSLRERLGVAE